MNYEYEIECIECVECCWSGLRDELLCSEEDFNDITKPTSECVFNICPDCGAVDNFEVIE